MTWDSQYFISLGSSILFVLALLTCYRFRSRTFTLLLMAALAVGAATTLLSAQSSILSKVLIGGDSGSDASIALGIFTIAATFVVAYVVVVGQRFEQRRTDLEVHVQDALDAAARVDALARQQETALADATVRLNLQSHQLRAFLYVYGELADIDTGEAGHVPAVFMDLKLLESLMFRTDWGLFRFDLEELSVVAASDPQRLATVVTGPILSYLRMIPEAMRVDEVGGSEDGVRTLKALEDTLSTIGAA